MRRSDYKVCPLCGAVLDIGEQCDCLESANDYRRGADIGAQGSRTIPARIHIEAPLIKVAQENFISK